MEQGTILVSRTLLVDDAVDDLSVEARLSSHTFLDRLIADWHANANRFDYPGECLLGHVGGGRLGALGGLNRDPHDTSGRAVGRLRHVYIAQSHRRRGLGRQLVTELLARAQGFERIRLRTPGTSEADAFYERLGFLRVSEPDATHAFNLRPSAPRRKRDCAATPARSRLMQLVNLLPEASL